MELKIVKSRPPDIRLKKNAEVRIHKKEFQPSSIKKKEMFSLRKLDGSFQIKRKKDVSCMAKEKQHQPKKAYAVKPRKNEQKPGIPAGRGTAEEGIAKRKEGKTEIPLALPEINDLNGKEQGKIFGQGAEENRKTDYKENGIQRQKRIRAEKRGRIPKTFSRVTQTAKSGLLISGQVFLQQAEKETESKDTFYLMDKTIRVSENRYIGKKTEKIRQPEKEMKIRKTERVQQEVKKKQRKQAIRERKLAYLMDKLSGQNQDSMAKTVKDIAIYKISEVLSTVGKKLLVLAAPVLASLLLVMLPVVLLFLVFYASPLAAFMPSVDGGPNVQEVLSGYYQEFHEEVKRAGGEVTYLHEKDGTAESNFMDTLMVYMVQYGTGDLGIVMDDTHKRYLKEVFEEMNSFEDKTVTTTIQAGQSLGQVVTSAYCSCSICCGQWSGGPTASGVMPTPNHTLAVDADNPFVPMGTRVLINGTEYVVEDTGAFDQFGVQFDVYFSDHAEASAYGHKTFEAYLADGNENTIEVTRSGAYVKNLNFEDYLALGKLTQEQETLLREVMSDEFKENLPSFGIGQDVANLARTKVGCRYSQEKRYEEGYYDCSSLVQRCYREFGLELPSIASIQGKFIVDNGLNVEAGMLMPGDLIFYSYEENGQFMNISHVAIYIGNGRMVHAANTARGVVEDPVNYSNINLYGRPSLYGGTSSNK